jgi:uncharacterized membrane-anchored protein
VNKLLKIALTVILALPMHSLVAQQSNNSNQVNALDWVKAPNSGDIDSRAKIQLSGNIEFLNSLDTKRFLVLQGNPGRDGRYAIANRQEGWFAILNFINDGYVKDDEKIDPEALLKLLKESNQASIEERKKAGIPILYLDGWYTQPHYDQVTKRLEWATKLHDEQNETIINYTSRILGRAGYMNAVLVSNPENLDRDIKSYKLALKGFDYYPGQRYSEFQSGDKIAEYGLGALVLGGAAAVAAKKGFFAVIASFFALAWKWILGAGLLFLYKFKSIFSKKD